MEIEKKKKYIPLAELEIYQMARELSRLSWDLYKNFDWQMKKIIGDQFITAIDSCGANIAEGYSRYHYLDKIKFYYNARASLTEAIEHWLSLLLERRLIVKDKSDEISKLAQRAAVKLNNFISSTYKAKYNQSQ